jgi:hypothetical protein
MMSSGVDPDAHTETLPPVYVGRARAVLITEDGTRVLPGIDTDETPMAFVDETRTMVEVPPDPKDEVAEAPRPLSVRIAAVSALAVMAVCGMLVVALAMALATR